MQEFAIYSVIPPEGCAAILWRDPTKKVEAAAALKLTAPDLLKTGIIDEIIPEPVGGAHTDYALTAQLIDGVLQRLLDEVGGLDSAVLLASELADRGPALPIHVRVGLAWEEAEAAAIRLLVAAPPFAGAIPGPVTLGVDMRDVYAQGHWAITGDAPAFDTPDEDVYLAGRNIVLVGKAAVVCASRGITRLVLGPLAGNPFPDATPEFFGTMARAIWCRRSLTSELAPKRNQRADIHRSPQVSLTSTR